MTWLYGPLQPATNCAVIQDTSDPKNRPFRSNLLLNKKSILKKRSMAELMLQKYISASSLLTQFAAARAQQATSVSFDGRRRRSSVCRATAFDFALILNRNISRYTTDYSLSQSTSGPTTPNHGERKHVRFDEKVEQCIAVERKGVDEDYEEDFNRNPWAKYRDDDSLPKNGVLMMERSRRQRPLSRTNWKTSIGGEDKTIAKLPSAAFKYRTDSPAVTKQLPTHSLEPSWSSRLSPSPYQVNVRPSRSSNFPLPEDEEDIAFNPSGAYKVARVCRPSSSGPYPIHSDELPIEVSDSSVSRRKTLVIFVPLEDEDEIPQQPGTIGRIVETVNRARDIAHVIWNFRGRDGNGAD